MQEYTKATKLKMRELLSLAYGRELSEHLQELAVHFDDWKNKKITPWDLTELIHKFHNGPARKLFNLYDKLSMVVLARAVTNKYLSRDEIPDNIYSLIEEILKPPGKK